MDLNFNLCMYELDFIKNDFKINIYIKQRNNKKYWTIINNLTKIENIDLKKTLKDLKKLLSCNGTILKNEVETFIQIQGNHGIDVRNYLIKTYSISKENILLHGY